MLMVAGGISIVIVVSCNMKTGRHQRVEPQSFVDFITLMETEWRSKLEQERSHVEQQTNYAYRRCECALLMPSGTQPPLIEKEDLDVDLFRALVDFYALREQLAREYLGIDPTDGGYLLPSKTHQLLSGDKPSKDRSILNGDTIRSATSSSYDFETCARCEFGILLAVAGFFCLFLLLSAALIPYLVPGKIGHPAFFLFLFPLGGVMFVYLILASLIHALEVYNEIQQRLSVAVGRRTLFYNVYRQWRVVTDRYELHVQVVDPCRPSVAWLGGLRPIGDCGIVVNAQRVDRRFQCDSDPDPDKTAF